MIAEEQSLAVLHVEAQVKFIYATLADSPALIKDSLPRGFRSGSGAFSAAALARGSFGDGSVNFR
jgi:hypothetical protein